MILGYKGKKNFLSPLDLECWRDYATV